MTHDYSFKGDIRTSSRLYDAWRTAMDIRKFEIELYWKRATYFWTFIGFSLAAYGAVIASSNQSKLFVSIQSDALFLIANVGLVFSVAWYFVNRGSKYWQRNWEFQVDFLESKAIGPIYKTVFWDKDLKFSNLTSAYPFSVSKVNHILSLFVIGLFIFLAINTLRPICPDSGWTLSPTKNATAGCSVFAIFCLFKFGRMAKIHEPTNAEYSVRPVKISPEDSQSPHQSKAAI